MQGVGNPSGAVEPSHQTMVDQHLRSQLLFLDQDLPQISARPGRTSSLRTIPAQSRGPTLGGVDTLQTTIPRKFFLLEVLGYLNRLVPIFMEDPKRTSPKAKGNPITLLRVFLPHTLTSPLRLHHSASTLLILHLTYLIVESHHPMLPERTGLVLH